MAPVTLMALLAGALLLAAGTPDNLEEALQAQRARVAASPNDVEVLNDLGNLLALAGEWEQSEEVYRRALAIDANDVTALYNLALVLQERGKTKEAHRTLERVVELDPHHAWAHYQLGTLFAGARHRSKALHHYGRAFALDRSLVSPRVNPHIVENRYATEALLQAYLSQSPSTQAPRLYRQPGSVADLLLVESGAEPDSPESLETPADVESRRPRAVFDSRESPEDDEPEQGTSEESGQEPPAAPPGAAAQAPRMDEASAAEEGTDEGQAAEPPTVTPEVELDEPQPAGTGTFVPGLQSTGLLELEIVPADDPRPAP